MTKSCWMNPQIICQASGCLLWCSEIFIGLIWLWLCWQPSTHIHLSFNVVWKLCYCWGCKCTVEQKSHKRAKWKQQGIVGELKNEWMQSMIWHTLVYWECTASYQTPESAVWNANFTACLDMCCWCYNTIEIVNTIS